MWRGFKTVLFEGTQGQLGRFLKLCPLWILFPIVFIDGEHFLAEPIVFAKLLTLPHSGSKGFLGYHSAVHCDGNRPDGSLTHISPWWKRLMLVSEKWNMGLSLIASINPSQRDHCVLSSSRLTCHESNAGPWCLQCVPSPNIFIFGKSRAVNFRKINRSEYKGHSSSIYKSNIGELEAVLGGGNSPPSCFRSSGW